MPKTERSYRVTAIVLRHSDWGEADRLLTLFTRERGKLRALAKGARKARSRKAGHLEPFTHVRLQLAKGRDLPIVTQAETVDAYIPLRDDLVKTGRLEAKEFLLQARQEGEAEADRWGLVTVPAAPVGKGRNRIRIERIAGK